MAYAGCRAISVTIIRATETRNALTPLLVARARATDYAAATHVASNTD
jgi:hypothetical protein